MPNKLDKEEFINRSIKKHGHKYKYDNVEYINQYTPVKIFCPKHGDFEQIPKSHMNGYGCSKCATDKFKVMYTGKNKIHKLQHSQIISNLKDMFPDYDYSRAYIEDKGRDSTINDVVCKKHGNFSKRLTNHYRQKQGCNLCGSNKLSKEEFIKRSDEIHQGKYDYSNFNYVNNSVKSEIKCPKHGIFNQSPLKHLSGQGCPVCYADSISKGEEFIRNYLNSKDIRYEYQKNISGTKLKMDFFIPRLNLCIEYDGIQHFKPRTKFGGEVEYQRQLSRDNLKDEYCQKNNIKIVRISYKNFTKLKQILDDITVVEKLKYIKTYENFSSEPIHIFDLDDTLMDTPSFEELVVKLIREDVSVEDLLNRSVKAINVRVDDLKWENGRIYVNDPEEKITPIRNWVRKGKRVYLTSPDKFYYLEESLPTGLKELADKYKSVKYKAIVTGRTEEMRDKILEVLNKFGLEEPNLGLYCYPNRTQTSDRVATWKGKTIIKLIQENGAKEAYFYEDKSKWLKTATKMVREKLPEVNFIPVKA